MESIHEAAKRRQMQTNSELRFDSLCSKLPLIFVSEIHGHHRWCYKKFTNVSRLVVTSTEDDGGTNTQSGQEANIDRRSSSRTNKTSGFTSALLPQAGLDYP